MRRPRSSGKKIEAGRSRVSIKTGEGGKSLRLVSLPRRSRQEAKSQLAWISIKKKIQLKETIKTLGTYSTLPVKLHPKVTVELKVVVTEEA
ncbi:MAG: 50S ribosomal L9 C-terminal domain-containing protein [Lachnospiraceae bacterium]